MSLYPIVTLSVDFQYMEVLFVTKKLSLSAIATVTAVTQCLLKCFSRS